LNNLRKLHRVVFLGLLGASGAFADPVDEEVRALVKRYVQAINTGDAKIMVRELYSHRDHSAADQEAAWSATFDALRRDDFGRVDFYGLKVCARDAGSAVVELRYSLQYTFGGVMPPGDVARRFSIVQTTEGQRIAEDTVIPFDPAGECRT
jgi:hypothetical protein